MEKIASSNKNKVYNFLKAAINEEHLNKIKKIIENNTNVAMRIFTNAIRMIFKVFYIKDGKRTVLT